MDGALTLKAAFEMVDRLRMIVSLVCVDVWAREDWLAPSDDG